MSLAVFADCFTIVIIIFFLKLIFFSQLLSVFSGCDFAGWDGCGGWVDAVIVVVAVVLAIVALVVVVVLVIAGDGGDSSLVVAGCCWWWW